jgi:hypothetical protein
LRTLWGLSSAIAFRHAGAPTSPPELMRYITILFCGFKSGRRESSSVVRVGAFAANAINLESHRHRIWLNGLPSRCILTCLAVTRFVLPPTPPPKKNVPLQTRRPTRSSPFAQNRFGAASRPRWITSPVQSTSPTLSTTRALELNTLQEGAWCAYFFFYVYLDRRIDRRPCMLDDTHSPGFRVGEERRRRRRKLRFLTNSTLKKKKTSRLRSIDCSCRFRWDQGGAEMIRIRRRLLTESGRSLLASTHEER